MTDLEITYDEIELIKESFCEGCKGMWFMHETGCYEECEGFLDKLREGRNEMGIDMEEVIKAFIKSGAKCQDGTWEAFDYKIYWAGTVLRIDLKPREE